MADVTISSLSQAPAAGNALLPFSNGSSTSSVPVSAIFHYAGNIGIGEVSPTVKLDVNGVAIANYFALKTNTASAPFVDAAITRPADGNLALITFGAERLRIDSLGTVSIPGKLTNAGVAKAWVNFDGVNGSVVGGEFRCNILKNYNIDRVVRTTTGRYTVYFTTAAPDAYYVVTGACNYNNANTDSLTIFTVGSQYTNYCQVVSRGYGSVAGYYDPSSMHVVIHY